MQSKASLWCHLLLLSAALSLGCCQNVSDASVEQVHNQETIFPVDTLQNVSGTFKGAWQKSVDGNPQTELLSRPSGALYVKLSDVIGHEEDATILNDTNQKYHSVQGEIVIRDGFHHEDDEDIVFALEGVYVESIQRLHAVATSNSKSMTQHVEEHEYASNSLPYRQALSDLASRYLEVTDHVRRGRLLPGGVLFSEVDDMISPDQLKLTKPCEFVLDIRVSLPNETAVQGRKAHEQPYIFLNGTAISKECGLTLDLGVRSTHMDVFITKAVKYTVLMTFITFLQIWLLTRQATSSGTQAQLSATSQLMMGQQAVIDAVLCLAHLSTGIMVEPVFNAFATTAFFEFVLFAVFELRMILNIWRARRSQDIDMTVQRRELMALYIRFYLGLLISIILSYKLQRFIKVLTFLAFSFWMPQIFHCAYSDTRQPLRALYLWGTSLSRLLLPVYMFGCPYNMLKLEVSYGFCGALCGWVCFQVLVIQGQSRFGQRFFVPKRFLPPKYDYFHTITAQQISESPRTGPKDIETGDAGHECVICMNPIDLADNAARMVTPCNHYFHPACLQRWMLVKMECPTCRSVLPPE